MKLTERMAELEHEHERITRAVAEGQAQLLRIEGAILMLRELIEKEQATAAADVPADVPAEG